MHRRSTSCMRRIVGCPWSCMHHHHHHQQQQGGGEGGADSKSLSVTCKPCSTVWCTAWLSAPFELGPADAGVRHRWQAASELCPYAGLGLKRPHCYHGWRP
jgi:hypothetical protein